MVRTCSIAIVVGLLLSSLAHARNWTNTEGQSIEADIVKVSGATVLLNKNGEIIRAPINKLSDADQAYVAAYKELRKFREWSTGDGKTRRARFVELRDGKAVLKEGIDEVEYELHELTEADRNMIAQVEESAPAVDGVASTASTVESPTAPAAWPRRVFTNAEGTTILAELRGVEGDKAILYFKDREFRYPMANLSADDRQWIAEQQRSLPSGGLANEALAGNSAPMAPPAVTPGSADADGMMDEIRGRMIPGYHGEDEQPAAPTPPPVDDYAAQAQARHERMIAEAERQRLEAERRHEEAMAAANQPPSPSAPTPPTDNFADGPSIPQPRHDFSEPTYTPPPVPVPSTPAPAAEYEHVIICDCGYENPAANFHAGDRCGGCGTVIGIIYDEQGKVSERSSSGGRVSARGVAAIVSLVVGVLGWLGRKVFDGND